MILNFVTILTMCFTCVELVLVRVEEGILKGKCLNRSTGNGIYYSFKGIRYAAPHVGDLRFKPPQPPLPWKGIRSAESHGSKCPQIEVGSDVYVPGDEDCLFLNLYSPFLNPDTRLPVMFYIHGGYYMAGSGNDAQFAPDFLLDHNVVLVTINYRLGTLGFLSFDIEEAPGNCGLKDQVAAMRWVQRNIANFGGDPDNVTIFGHSAGGSSATLHVLSPMSKGLFKRAIAMSGAFLKDFSVPFEHKRRAFLLTQQLGLYTQGPREALQFLKNVSVKCLVKAKPFVLYSEKPRRDVLEFYHFRPIVEKDFGAQQFLIEDPQKLLSENRTNNVELILGHTTEEGIYRTVTQKTSILKYYPLYKELLVPAKIANADRPTERSNIS